MTKTVAANYREQHVDPGLPGKTDRGEITYDTAKKAKKGYVDFEYETA
jgi:hypothetical protein